MLRRPLVMDDISVSGGLTPDQRDVARCDHKVPELGLKATPFLVALPTSAGIESFSGFFLSCLVGKKHTNKFFVGCQ